eukprot:CAMPEP_0172415288 /NCGR_PEP_ID=MMETSP1064-20121228/1733_1 /TAXON_ID=202472 /ORGANISM="Aulacoseira subarctica , Strain CCAP 1002/5" /LENGTH=457 /DNA_ID=CAMNT_0013152225 /DNA_START=38 /DNA_END=1411 /DNA_ORIENTATION=-
MQVLAAGGIRRGKAVVNTTTPTTNNHKTNENMTDNKLPASVELISVPEVHANTQQPTHGSSMQDNYSFQPPVLEQPNSQLLQKTKVDTTTTTETIWLVVCFLGIMASFVIYGLLLEYTTSGGRHLHELSFLFVTSVVYTLTAAAGRYVRDETPTTIPPARFALLGLTSMGSTFCSVRSLRYVIYPIQVLAKSCKPVPVMLMGALMGKKYSLKKYINVFFIVLGVGLFTGGGKMSSSSSSSNNSSATVEKEDTTTSSHYQTMGILLLFISLCFDGGTGAYEDKLMSVHQVGPFDLMYNIQLGKTILAGVCLLVLNQVHVFVEMCADMGFLLVALGLSGALGQVFIFVTISKFGALTCSIIGLARKVATLCASIYFYGHILNKTQVLGLIICIGSMVANFGGKKGHGDHHSPPVTAAPTQYRDREMTNEENDREDDEDDKEEEKPLIIGDKSVEMLIRL